MTPSPPKGMAETPIEKETERMCKAMIQADSILSLIVHRGSVRWGEEAMCSKQEAQDAYMALRYEYQNTIPRLKMALTEKIICFRR